MARKVNYLKIRDRLRSLHVRLANLHYQIYCEQINLDEARTMKQQEKAEGAIERCAGRVNKIKESIDELTGYIC